MQSKFFYSFSRSVVFKILLVMIISMTLITIVSIFVFNKHQSKFLKELKTHSEQIVFVVNNQGEVFYHPEFKNQILDIHAIPESSFDSLNLKHYRVSKSLLKFLNSGNYIANYHYDKKHDLGILLFQPQKELDSFTTSFTQASIAVLIFSILTILVIATWMFFRIGTPLNKLIQHINKITQGDIDISAIKIEARNDEIGLLSKAFNSMHHTIKRQIKELNAHREMLEQEVLSRTKELEQANEKLKFISKTDDLTGLPNRRNMNEMIATEVDRVYRNKKPFCFIFMDIDNFKSINDTYGHACGDLVLKTLAQTIRSLLRKYDVFSRYGGEEFLALLPETSLAGAAIVAERFRQKVESMRVDYADLSINITITLGVSQYDERLGADRSIQMADRALYKGKENGRNQVVVWQKEWTSNAEYEAAAIDLLKNP